MSPENVSSCYARFHYIDDATVSFREDSCHVGLQKLDSNILRFFWEHGDVTLISFILIGGIQLITINVSTTDSDYFQPPI